MVAIRPYSDEYRDSVLQLSLRSWAAVFPRMRAAVPAFVYDAFYPNGWQVRQYAEMSTVLDGEPENVDLAFDGAVLAGWMCTRLHPEDRMGEIYVLAVDPEFQRRGVGAELISHAAGRARAAGMRMMMVETGDDPGHAPSRATYEASGFQRWPVARFFKDLF